MCGPASRLSKKRRRMFAARRRFAPKLLQSRCIGDCEWADNRGSGASIPKDAAAQSQVPGK